MKEKKKKFKKKRKIGLAPGSLIFTGKKKLDQVLTNLLVYNKELLKESRINPKSIKAHINNFTHWYDIRGLHNIEILQDIGKALGIHTLALEDIADVNQRAKFDFYENGVYFVLRFLRVNNETLIIDSEQVSFYLGENFLISFQEDEIDIFEPIRQRLEIKESRLRQKKADYLMYALIDYVVDHYYVVLDHIEEQLLELEDELLEDVGDSIKQQIYFLKRQVTKIRKYLIPLREALSSLSKTEHNLIEDSNIFFLRDLYDHSIQIIDTLESQRELIASLQDLYASKLSLKMNNVMQTLTITATIFIPLTFVAGIYGMNFKKMPELEWEYGYLFAWIIMVSIVICMFYYFKKKKWF